MSKDSVSNEKSTIKSVVTLVGFGTACWWIAGVVTLVMDVDTKIVWTCVTGAILGAMGMIYSVRRNRREGI